MAEPNESDDRNGTVPAPVEVEYATTHKSKGMRSEDQAVYVPVRRLIAEIFFPDETKGSFSQRVKASVAENGHAVAQACRNFGHDILCWTRRGSPLRALLVISVSIADNSKMEVVWTCFSFFWNKKRRLDLFI